MQLSPLPPWGDSQHVLTFHEIDETWKLDLVQKSFPEELPQVTADFPGQRKQHFGVVSLILGLLVTKAKLNILGQIQLLLGFVTCLKLSICLQFCYFLHLKEEFILPDQGIEKWDLFFFLPLVSKLLCESESQIPDIDSGVRITGKVAKSMQVYDTIYGKHMKENMRRYRRETREATTVQQ